MLPQRYLLHPSSYLTSLLLFMHAMAAASVLLLPLWWCVPLLAAILPGLLYALLHSARLRLPGSCIALELAGDEAVLYCRDGSMLTGRVLPDTLISPLLVVLNIRPNERRRSRSVVIMRDAMDQEDLRNLRLALRWQT